MQTVCLEMETQSHKKVFREIDITNICFSGSECWNVAQNREHQKELLNNWIQERGNEQHNTILTLKDWWII